MSQDYILIIPPTLHEGGISICIESDIHANFRNSLESLGYEPKLAQFETAPNGAVSLNLNYLSELISKNKNAILIIDGNLSPSDSGVYPQKLLGLLKDSSNPKVCILPDLLAAIDYLPWVTSCDFIIAFHLQAIKWANIKYNTKKFIYFPSIPIPRLRTGDYSNFCNRLYDIGYIGSSKNFRVAFIDSLCNLAGNSITKLIITSHNRKDSHVASHEEYLNLYSKCKYIFVTRAALYESFHLDNKLLSTQKRCIYTRGRFAGRVSEALAAGCIPLYWEPRFPRSIIEIKLQRLRYISRKLKLFRDFLFRNSGDPAAWPFDERCDELKCGVATIKDPREAQRILTEHSNIRRERWLTSQKIYETFVAPEIFFERLEKLVRGTLGN